MSGAPLIKFGETARLDIFIAEAGGVSRAKAQDAIKDGLVSVNGKIVTKAAFPVKNGDTALLSLSETKFVGRGGFKLEGALEAFGITLHDRICADIGASTGGFTDCMLQHGAKRVYAVENGAGQLSPGLISDTRVVSIENTDRRTLGVLPEPVSFAAADVSFISLKLVIPHIFRLLEPDGQAVLLLKPQFEAGKGKVPKSGVISDISLHKKIIADMTGFAAKTGFRPRGCVPSPIKGRSGNVEYLMYCSKMTVGDDGYYFTSDLNR
jgi:23S rRNA (cytidine1920-2'-O)/16S rRNA (cytidine1409-2'-O)-methyltransferase